MDFKIMSSEDFNVILEAQVELNKKYSGEDWAEKIPKSHFVSALYAELGELLESSPRTGDTDTGWKWWKIYLENDVDNMKIEAVDIIHFAMSILILCFENDIDELKKEYEILSKEYLDFEVRNIINEYYISKSKGVSFDLLTSISYFSLCSMTKTKEDLLNSYMFLKNSLCNYSDMTTEYMLYLYMKKNKLNHERVEGGYTESATAYAKIDENGNEDNTKLFLDGKI